MKYIKKFKIYEGIIIPNQSSDDSIVSSFESLVEYGKNNDFDVVEYDEFFDSLSESDKRTAPPRYGTPFFALFNPIRKRPMFVICDKNIINIIPDFKSAVDDIIGHEKIHGEQTKRRSGIDFNLPNPSIKKEYFSNKEEIMAFSYSIARSLFKKYDNIKDCFYGLKNDTYRDLHYMLWKDIKRVCDDKVIKRYEKYIYMYLEQMFNN